MVNMPRLKEMIALAMYDESPDGMQHQTARYYRSDYIAVRMIGTALASTLGYLLLLLLLAAGNAESILSKLGAVDISAAIRILVIVYAVILALSLVGTYLIASRRYKEALKKEKIYRRHLEHLKTLDTTEQDT